MKALELGERAGHRKELLAEQGAPGPVPAGVGFPGGPFSEESEEVRRCQSQRAYIRRDPVTPIALHYYYE